MSADLLEMTVRLVTAHLANNKMDVDDVSRFLNRMYEDVVAIRIKEDQRTGKIATTATAASMAIPQAVVDSLPQGAVPAELSAPAISSRARPAAARAISNKGQAALGSSDQATGIPSVVEANHSSPPAPVTPPNVDEPGKAPVINDRIGKQVFSGLDPWLAYRIPAKVAKKLNPRNEIHPSVFPNHIVCLEDGKLVKLLKPHLERRHKMTVEQYIAKWNLPEDFPSTPPAYSALRRGKIAAIQPASYVEHAPVINTDISNPAFAGLDPWLAQRVPAEIAEQLDPNNTIHPSAFDDYFICLEDGSRVKLLKPYLLKHFQMSMADYIAKWKLPENFPSSPPSFIDKKRAIAKRDGLGHEVRAFRSDKVHEAAVERAIAASARAGKGTKAETNKAKQTSPKPAKAPGRPRQTLFLFSKKTDKLPS